MTDTTSNTRPGKATLDAALAPLIAQTRWVAWKYERPNGAAKPTKVPYQCNGYRASTNKEETWTTYEAATRAASRFDGIGFVFTRSGCAAFDIDHCRNAETGDIHPWALSLVERCGSYAEITPSGTGIRIIGTSALPALKTGQAAVPGAEGVTCEIFRQQGYITITGQVLKSAPLADLDEQIAIVMQELEQAEPRKARTTRDEVKSEWVSKYMPKDLPPGQGRGISDRPEDNLFREINAAAAVIPNNDLGWDDWNYGGMVLFASTGGNPEGLTAFHEWSRKSKKYDEQTTNAKWEAYYTSPPKDLHVGTLFYMANQADPNWRRHGEDDNDPRPNNNESAKQQIGPAFSVEDWLSRDLPKPDFICGKWLTTTSRVIAYAPTGIGKTLLFLGLGMSVAAAIDFLHWKASREVRVLFVDGEMSRRVMKDRIAAEVSRIGGVIPVNMHVLSHEDVEIFYPLNSKKGQDLVEQEIAHIGGIDLIVFDNIMSLIAGDMKEELGWRQTLPWIRSLTRRSIAQIWIHHTGHDESHSYGTKTREWQMDTIIRLERIEQRDTDVSFLLCFEKAREREPSTRTDFADVRVALVGDKWIWEGTSGVKQKQPSPNGRKFYEVLCRACDQEKYGQPATTIEKWREACFGTSLLDRERLHSARTLFGKHKLELIAGGWISCDETMVWTHGPNPEEVF